MDAGDSRLSAAGGGEGGYLTKFQQYKKPNGLRRVHRDMNGDDDCISELTSLGGGISLPPLATGGHPHDQGPKSLGDEGGEGRNRNKERTLSAPARTRTFEDEALSLPDIRVAVPSSQQRYKSAHSSNNSNRKR